ncbi:MAG: hypothetical protein QGG88_10290 [Gammaproteobacteria bacterium]|jgi:hypothetical protein|nr:hypothetical protein [Gammaproteobacteria bacterium]
MHYWRDFLQQQGFTHLPQGGIEAAENNSDTDADTYLTDLSNYGHLTVSGPDAHKFLQGQLTCDLNKLTAEQWLAGAYCTPKGSVIANFDLLQVKQDFILHMAADVIPAVQANLSKYIVFSKAQLHSQDTDWICLGIWGAQAHTAVQQLVTMPATQGEVRQFDQGFVFCTSTIQQRYVVYCQLATAQSIWQQLGNHAQPTSTAAWEISQIKDGLIYVNDSISGEYVPQMLNLQELGSIDFHKGCYTGQEIVARMQYLGKLKRHLYIGRINTATTLQTGMPITAGARSNVGQITSLARAEDKDYWLTAVINIKAENEPLTIGEADHSQIELQALPYSIDQQVFERIKL